MALRKDTDMTAVTDTAPAVPDTQSFLLRRVQPALSGLMDGSLSTLAPIFAVILATHHPLTAFFTGAATALGAGVSMAFSEGLSDTGDLTGRGSPVLRGAITGGGTFTGGIFHTLPFLIPGYGPAISAAVIVVACELLILAYLRHKYFHTSFARSFVAVAVGGAIIAALSAGLGVLATS
jgi:erythrin-vacuolar iron transport family protein